MRGYLNFILNWYIELGYLNRWGSKYIIFFLAKRRTYAMTLYRGMKRTPALSNVHPQS